VYSLYNTLRSVEVRTSILNGAAVVVSHLIGAPNCSKKQKNDWQMN